MDRYETLKQIGSNHYATVWQGNDFQMDRKVAIMALHQKFFRNEQISEQIWRDIKAMSEIGDKNIVSVHDIVPDKRWVVMQLMSGTLGSRLDSDAVSSDLGRSVMRQILEALHRIHEAGKIHGDIKPNNMLYNDEGRVLLAFSPGLFIAGTVPNRQDDQKYQAPELLKTDAFGNVGPGVDLYCLGFSMLALLKGPGFDNLFRGVNLDPKSAWTRWHGDPNQELPAANIVIPHLPKDLALVIDGLLKKKVDERYQTAKQVLQDLDDAPIELIDVEPDSAPAFSISNSTRKGATVTYEGGTPSGSLAASPRSGAGASGSPTGNVKENPKVKQAEKSKQTGKPKPPTRPGADPNLKPWSRDWINHKLQNPYVMGAVLAGILVPLLIYGIFVSSGGEKTPPAREFVFQFDPPIDSQIEAWIDGKAVPVESQRLVVPIPEDQPEFDLKASAQGYLTLEKQYRTSDLTGKPIRIALTKVSAPRTPVPLGPGPTPGPPGGGGDPGANKLAGSTPGSSTDDGSMPPDPPGPTPTDDLAKARSLRDEGLKHLEQQAYDLARERFSKAIELAPTMLEVHRDRARSLSPLGELQAAVDDLKQELKLSPEDAESYLMLGQLYATSQRLGEATAAFSRAIDIDPELADAWAGRAFAYIGQEQFEEALSDTEQVLKIYPDHPVALNSRGAALWGLKRFAEALAAFDQAVRGDRLYREAYFNRGRLYLEMATTMIDPQLDMKHYAKAIEDFSRAIDLQPDFAPAFYYRGRSYSEGSRRSLTEQDELGRAMQDYNRAIELDPNYADAYEGRSKVFRALGQSQRAQQDSQKALSLNR